MPDFPRAQIIPQPDAQLSFEMDGREVLRYHYADRHPKPFFFPVIGPGGRPVTRLGHPHDPHGHRHHYSLWVAHSDVNGCDFWSFGRKHGRIVHDRLVKIEDGDRAALTVRAQWLDDQQKPLLADERVWTFTPLYETWAGGKFGEFFLDLTLSVTPIAAAVTLGKTPFGLLAVRVAKTMGVHDGGGRITHSEGGVNESQVLWRRARWCDYSGSAAPGRVVNGITLFDHPLNPRHPTYFHVRDDGWMGASLTYAEPLDVTQEQPLTLRYRFWIHTGWCDLEETEAHWNRWSHAVG